MLKPRSLRDENKNLLIVLLSAAHAPRALKSSHKPEMATSPPRTPRTMNSESRKRQALRVAAWKVRDEATEVPFTPVSSTRSASVSSPTPTTHNFFIALTPHPPTSPSHNSDFIPGTTTSAVCPHTDHRTTRAGRAAGAGERGERVCVRGKVLESEQHCTLWKRV